MQSSFNKEQHNIAQIFASHLELICQDIPAWIELFAENAVMEFPYASGLNVSARLEGKSAIYSHIKKATAQMQGLVFTNIRTYPTSNSNILFAEVHGEAVIVTTNYNYQQDYVMRLETKDGKIVHYREYWNPTPILAAWGGTQNLSQSFN